MDIASLPFAAFATVTVLLYNAFRHPHYRRIILLAANFAFLASFANSPLSLMPFLAFVILGFLALQIIDESSSLRLSIMAISLVCVAFVYLKQYSVVAFIPDLSFSYVLIGTSYVLFRIIHLLVDRHQGAIEGPITAVGYLNYVLFFPAFISGPIQRYQEFRDSRFGREISADVVYQAFSRILSGGIKIVLISPIFLAGYERALDGVSLQTEQANLRGFLQYGAAAGAFYVHFYFSFQGYMDIIIGIARLMGIQLPENFNNPFAAKNFLDFWTRWHITLASWFRTYLFNPLLKLLIRLTAWRQGSNYLAVLAFFVTFLVMGVWHGTSSLWFIYGLFLAVGVSVNKLYQVVSTNIMGRKRYGALCKNPLYSAMATGMTFAYVSLAFTAFWPNQATMSMMSGTVMPIGLVTAFGGIAIGVSALNLLLLPWLTSTSLIMRRLRDRAQGNVVRNGWLAVKLFILVGAALLVSAIPETVYKPF